MDRHQLGPARVGPSPTAPPTISGREIGQIERGWGRMRGRRGAQTLRTLSLQARLEQPDVLRARDMTVAASEFERGEGAKAVEIRREAGDHVEHDLLDPLRVLGEDLQDGPGVDRLRALVDAGVVIRD